jgi:hypothetical protein
LTINAAADEPPPGFHDRERIEFRRGEALFTREPVRGETSSVIPPAIQSRPSEASRKNPHFVLGAVFYPPYSLASPTTTGPFAMDLNAFLLDGVVTATAPPNETESAARSRADAILEMVRAYDPADGMEAMIACHCVMLQFLLNAAMRDANNIHQEPAVLAKSRAGAISISRTLHQWVTKLEKVKKRNETRAAEAPESAEIKGARATKVKEAAETQTVPAQKSPDAPPVIQPATAITPPTTSISAANDGSQAHAPSVSINDRRKTA